MDVITRTGRDYTSSVGERLPQPLRAFAAEAEETPAARNPQSAQPAETPSLS